MKLLYSQANRQRLGVVTLSNQRKGKENDWEEQINSFNVNGKEAYRSMTPQQIAVIIALLTKVLKVRAVVLDVDQNVEVVLQGSLKSKSINRLINEMNGIPPEKWLAMLQKFPHL